MVQKGVALQVRVNVACCVTPPITYITASSHPHLTLITPPPRDCVLVLVLVHVLC